MVKRKAKGKRQNSERANDVTHHKDKRKNAVIAGVEEKIEDVIHQQDKCKSAVTSEFEEKIGNVTPQKETFQSSEKVPSAERVQDMIQHKGKRQSSETPQNDDKIQDVIHQQEKHKRTVTAKIEEGIQDVMRPKQKRQSLETAQDEDKTKHVIHCQENLQCIVTADAKEKIQDVMHQKEKCQSVVTAGVEEDIQNVIPSQEKRQSSKTTAVEEKIQDVILYQRIRQSSDGEEKIRSVINHKVPIPGNFYQIKLKNCQIGNNNTLMQSNNDTEGAALKGMDGSAKTRSQTHTGKLILQKIFSTNNNKPMLFADLETRLNEYISCEKLNTFKVETGWTLRDFLLKNKDCYEIYVKRKRQIVKLKEKIEYKSSSEEKTKKEPETQSPDSHPRNINDDTVQLFTIDSCEDFGFSHALSDEGTWTEVTSRKKKRSQCISTTQTEQFKSLNDSVLYEKASKPTYAAAVNASLSQVRQRAWKPERFEAVLQNGENRDTLFVRSPDIYVRNPLRFSLDVVSLWNTPHRKNSYIILGVSNAELVGIDKSFNVNIFKNLFQKHYFSQKPVFSSFVIDYALKRFCIIEIESSCGHGGPCVVETDAQGADGISILERQVWVRSGARNVVCNVKYVTEVYQWFIGQLPKSKHAQNGEDKKEKEQSVRHAGTNTKSSTEFTDFSSSDEEPLYSSGDTFSFFWEAVKGFKKAILCCLPETFHVRRNILTHWLKYRGLAFMTSTFIVAVMVYLMPCKTLWRLSVT